MKGHREARRAALETIVKTRTQTEPFPHKREDFEAMSDAADDVRRETKSSFGKFIVAFRLCGVACNRLASTVRLFLFLLFLLSFSFSFSFSFSSFFLLCASVLTYFSCYAFQIVTIGISLPNTNCSSIVAQFINCGNCGC